MTTELLRAIVESYDSANHEAKVRPVTAPGSVLATVTVSAGIHASEVTVADECVVALNDDASDPNDAVIVAVYGSLPPTPVTAWLSLTDTPASFSGQALLGIRVNAGETALEFVTLGGGGGTKIEDADADTKVDVEEGADDDVVRMDVAGVERFHLKATSPRLKITGELLVTEHIGGKGVAAIEPKRLLDIGGGATYTQQVGLHVGLGSSVTPAAGAVMGIAGLALAKTVGDINAVGLQFVAGMSNIDLAIATGCDVQAFSFGSGKTITDLNVFRAKAGSNIFSIRTNNRAFYANSNNVGTNRYGFICDQISGGTIARMIECAADWFIIKGSGEWTAAANETPMWLTEGTTPTSRQVKWKAGNVLVAGDKVMVLV